VKFHHVATGLKVEFPAFITEFNDSVSVSWGTESIFGRTDPVMPYQGTTRNIALGFDVLSPTLAKARENMQNYSKLVQMMYPVYSPPLAGANSRGRVLKAPPLIRLQFMNLIQNTSRESPERGLLGCINGFSFNPNRESGFYDVDGELFSKNFNISFSFSPQHEQPMGFQANRFTDTQFPYGTAPTTEQQDSTVATNSSVNQSRQNNILGDS
jgi:hypothetical protein